MHFFITLHDGHTAFRTAEQSGSYPGTVEALHNVLTYICQYYPDATYEIRDERSHETSEEKPLSDSCCPRCHSNDIEGKGYDLWTENLILQDSRCSACGHYWTFNYQLTGIGYPDNDDQDNASC